MRPLRAVRFKLSFYGEKGGIYFFRILREKKQFFVITRPGLFSLSLNNFLCGKDNFSVNRRNNVNFGITYDFAYKTVSRTAKTKKNNANSSS